MENKSQDNQISRSEKWWFLLFWLRMGSLILIYMQCVLNENFSFTLISRKKNKCRSCTLLVSKGAKRLDIAFNALWIHHKNIGISCRMTTSLSPIFHSYDANIHTLTVIIINFYFRIIFVRIFIALPVVVFLSHQWTMPYKYVIGWFKFKRWFRDENRHSLISPISMCFTPFFFSSKWSQKLSKIFYK